MSGVARDNHKIADKVASNYIGWRKWNPNHHTEQQWNPNINCHSVCDATDPDTGVCTSWHTVCDGGYETVYVGGYDTGTVDATIKGTVNATHNNGVFINGYPVCVDGDIANETATYTLPSGAEKTSGADSGTGTVNASGSVYVGGRAVAKNGTNVGIYAGGNTIINEGSSNVFIN
jgi:uncharacterized Zn-binding protein involved in type VI secretion